MDLVSGQQLLKITERHSDIMCLLTGGNTAKQEVKPKFDQTSRFTNQSTGETTERSMEKETMGM